MVFNLSMPISLVKEPAWSPDGNYIVYRQTHWPTFLNQRGSGELWIMRADGSQATKLTDGPIDRGPDWRPVP
jgi:Tol biopolymer transport system component